LAKRKTPREQSLFDNLDPDAGGNGRAAVVRSQVTGGSGGGSLDNVALHEAAQSRYLNYALSVITSRALPDVRDGL
jgi:DNA gyrase subunit A